MVHSIQNSLLNIFSKIRGVAALDEEFFNEFHGNIATFLHQSQGVRLEDYKEAIDELIDRIRTYSLPRGFSRSSIATKLLYEFFLDFFGPHFNTLIDISDLKSYIHVTIQSIIEIEENLTRDKDQEDPPTPFIYSFPYPKGPPVAAAERNPKQCKIPFNDSVSEPILNSSDVSSSFVPAHKKLSLETEEEE